MSGLKKTISSIFMVPTLKIGNERLRINGFINGYHKDDKQDVPYPDSCYLLFKPNRMEMFNQFVNEEYARTKNVIDDYDYEGGFVVMVYKLNAKYKKDFELVRQGRYSECSQAFQNEFDKIKKIIKEGSVTDQPSLPYRIFNKTEDLKDYWESKLAVNFKDDFEVWDGWSDEKETLKIEQVKEELV